MEGHRWGTGGESGAEAPVAGTCTVGVGICDEASGIGLCG